VSFHAPLPDIPQRTFGDANPGEFFFGMNGQEYELGTAAGFTERMDGVDAIHSWHRDIRDNHVRREAGGLSDQRRSIARCAYDVKTGTEESNLSLKQLRMVIS
jgi:hypothetical protein